MKKLDLGQLISIVANLGVIGGLIFLGLELRQNNEVLQLQVDSENTDRVNSMVELVINNPGYSELMAKEESELSEFERDRLNALGLRVLLNFESLYRDVMLGRADEEEAIRRLRAVWYREKLNYGAPLTWEMYKPRADPGFIQWMEDNIITR